MGLFNKTKRIDPEFMMFGNILSVLTRIVEVAARVKGIETNQPILGDPRFKEWVDERLKVFGRFTQIFIQSNEKYGDYGITEIAVDLLSQCDELYDFYKDNPDYKNIIKPEIHKSISLDKIEGALNLSKVTIEYLQKLSF
jgi:hypothetical protein